MAQLPLFPLKTVLFPMGRLPLQIFEQRYLAMVKQAMKTAKGFGVVTLKNGGEVGRPGDIYDLGVLVEIIDWNQLSNGLLGITVVGVKPFEVAETVLRDDNLLLGDIIFKPEEAVVGVPDELRHLKALLENLLEHSAVQKMDMACDFDNASQVSWLLGYLLPFSPETKIELLRVTEPVARLVRIATALDEMTQGLNQ